MAIWQTCVVCGKDVDVDNCFGVISESETYCDLHENIRLAIVEIEKIGTEINSLKIDYDDAYKKVRNLILESERLNQCKK